jgi:protein-disulfide isomerase
MDKRFIGIIIAIILGMVGIFVLTGGNKDKSGNEGSNADARPSSHVAGKVDSKVTLIEYGDFQCPACKSYFPIVSQLKKDYGDRVAFQFRHYPLVQVHPNAFLGSRAAEAAGKQDQFYEMHDLLYENQDSWSSSSNPAAVFESYARQLGLDIEKFKNDSGNSAVAGTINADVKAAQAAGADSTPTFVLNGRTIEQIPRNVDGFKKLLDEELAKN